MKTFRYSTLNNWYKGNTHIHSTTSDGGQDFNSLSRMYAGQGFDFLFRTDHWVSSQVEADKNSYPILWLDGVELDGEDERGSLYHIVCLGTFQGLERGLPLMQAVEKARQQGGFIILAHPNWTGNTQEDVLCHTFDGVEIYNHTCQWLNGKGDTFVFWEFMLEKYPDLLAFAVDDAHITKQDPGWNGGWIVVNAPELTKESIHQAVRAGNYYSSMGPEFHSIEYHNDTVYVKTSPVQFIRLVGNAYNGTTRLSLNGNGLTEAEFQVPEDWTKVHLQVEDDLRRVAWSNTLFIENSTH